MRSVDIPAGEDLVAAIAEVAGAWAHAVGTISGAALSVPSDEGEVAVELPGRSALVSLQGPPTGPLMAIVSRAEPEGRSTVAGRLIRAHSEGVTLVVHEVARAQGAATESSSGSAVVESEAQEEEEAEELPAYNDQVLHPKFGLCDVMVVRGERMKIREVAGLHRVREIHLSVVKVLPPRESEGKRVFPLAKREK